MAPEHNQALDLLARFETILKPYAAWIQKFHQAEWALKDRTTPSRTPHGEIS